MDDAERRCALQNLDEAVSTMPHSLFEGFHNRLREVKGGPGTIAEIHRLRADIEAATATAPVPSPTVADHVTQLLELQMEQATTDVHNEIRERASKKDGSLVRGSNPRP